MALTLLNLEIRALVYSKVMELNALDKYVFSYIYLPKIFGESFFWKSFTSYRTSIFIEICLSNRSYTKALYGSPSIIGLCNILFLAYVKFPTATKRLYPLKGKYKG